MFVNAIFSNRQFFCNQIKVCRKKVRISKWKQEQGILSFHIYLSISFQTSKTLTCKNQSTSRTYEKSETYEITFICHEKQLFQCFIRCNSESDLHEFSWIPCRRVAVCSSAASSWTSVNLHLYGCFLPSSWPFKMFVAFQVLCMLSLGISGSVWPFFLSHFSSRWWGGQRCKQR